MIDYSIVICTHNQKDTLRSSLDSLKNQIRNLKTFEIVIADDCSDDGTEEFVKKLRYPIFLKYSRSSHNEGRARNRNRGLEKAAGGKIIFIDGDMLPAPDFVGAHMRAWVEFPGALVVGSWRPPREWKLGKWDRYLCTRGRLVLQHGEKVPGRQFASGNFSSDKRLMSQLSGFDTSFENWGGEDTDFGLRLESLSIPIHYIPEALCFHYDRKSIADVIEQFEEFGQNGYRLLVQKHPASVVYPNGWMLGLPGAGSGILKKLISALMSPLRSSQALAILRLLAGVRRGVLLGDLCFDWLIYGHLARGYRKAKE